MKTVISEQLSVINSHFVIFIICLLLLSCSKTVYIPVESVRTEYKNVQFRDSVYVSDSIIIRTKADTVWYEKYKIYYQDRLLRDSIIVTDSVQVPYPVEVVKEVNKLMWWQRILIALGNILIVYIGIRVILWMIKSRL